MNNYQGDVVFHKMFGKGIIKAIEENRLIVDFEGTEKKFKFPDAFEEFLKFENDEKQLEVNALIEADKAEKENAAIKKAKERQEQALLYEKKKKERKDARIAPAREYLVKGTTFATHKDALNECFGFQYKHFQQAYKVVDDKFAVWFPSIARRIQDTFVATETSNGWVNVISEKDTVITEKHENNSMNTERDPKFDLDRFVFAKLDGEGYCFIGVFRTEHADKPWETGYRYRLIGTKVNLKTMEIE